MKQYFIISISLFFLSLHSLKAQEALPSASYFYTFTGAPNEDSINVYTFAGVGHDSARVLTISSLLSNPNALSWQAHRPKAEDYVYNWLCFRLRNTTKDTIRKYIRSAYIFDYMKLYKITDNSVVDSTIRGRFIPLSMNYSFYEQKIFYIELLPYSEADYYFNYYLVIFIVTQIK